MGQSFGDLNSSYHVEDVKLGEGSFGQVWRAVDRNTGEIVAVKKLDRSKVGPGRERSDLQHEVLIMQKVSHDNVLKLIGEYEDATHISVVLEYCDGGDFSEKLRERPEQPKGPCEFVASNWMNQICSAIAALHAANIVHRDVKPKNFMLSRGILKLADFGIAQILPQNGILFQKCGTPGFMAPEQHMLPMGEGYSLPVDMWAAGIVLYMMRNCGRHPLMVDGKLNRQALMQRKPSIKPKEGVWNAKTIHSLCMPPAKQRDAKLREEKGSKRERRSTHSGGEREIGSGMRGVEDLLDNLLAPDQHVRITAPDVLRHPWIVQHSAM